MWPFSKKKQNPYQSHCELPPGVVLATEGDEAPPVTAQHLQTGGHTPDVQAVSFAEASIALPRDGSPNTTEHPDAVTPEQAPPNSHFLDLFTPPATSDIHWQPIPEGSALQAGGSDLTFFEDTPAREDVPAHPVFDNAPAEHLAFDSTLSHPLEESFALTEASEQTLELSNTNPLPSIQAGEAETFELPSSQASPETPGTGNIPGNSPLSNVVPFPIRQPQASRVDAPILEEITEECALDFLHAASSEDTLSPDPSEASELASLVSMEASVPSYDWDSELSTGLIQGAAEEDSFWSIPAESETEAFFTPGEEGSTTDAEQPEPLCFELQPEEASLWLGEEAEGNSVSPQDAAIEFEAACELPAQNEAESFAMQDALPEALSGEFFDEGPEQNVSDGWGFEETEEGSSVKEWAAYDLGHYDDPDDPTEPLLLGEEPDAPVAGEFQADEPAVGVNASSRAEVSPEPVDVLGGHASDLPVYEARPLEPVNGEILADDWRKIHSPASVAKAMNNFSQQIILEESRAIKRSIDDLVERYFSRQWEP